MSAEGKTPGTIEGYVGTVRVMHRLAGITPPSASQIHYQWHNDGLKKTDTRSVRQAKAMTHEILRKISSVVDYSRELHVVAFIAVLVAFAMVLRVANIGPLTRKMFDSVSHFTRADFVMHEGHPSLGIRWSKTVQHRNKTKITPIIPSADKSICAVRWILKMLHCIPAHSHEPLFLIREGINRYPLTSGQVRRLLKMWCEQIGIDPAEYTPHSLRVGGLNWGRKAHLSGEALQLLGGWCSNTYVSYIRSEFEEHVENGQKMKEIEC